MTNYSDNKKFNVALTKLLKTLSYTTAILYDEKKNRKYWIITEGQKEVIADSTIKGDFEGKIYFEHSKIVN